MPNPKRNQFQKGFHFANVPGGKPENAVVDSGVGPVVTQVNTVHLIVHASSDKSSMSGVITFRSRARPRLPPKVVAPEGRNTDVFGNWISPGVR